jgi:hypothetical protein
MVLLISYDLNGHERPAAYEVVEKMIKNKAISWAKPLYSQWFVDTTESPTTWSNRMKEITDSNDRWFICRVNGERQGWLSQEVWDWLNART